MMDSKLETMLQILQNMQNTRCCPSGGSNSYDLFRGNGDGVSSRRSSVSRAHSDPLDVRTLISGTSHATDNSDIPYVTLSDPESVQSSLSDRSQGSRPHSQTSLYGSLSSADRRSINQLDGFPVGELSSVNSALSRVLVPDRRQLSDVTEESLTGSKETVGGLTPPGPISQQNSTASESDPASGGTENEAPSGPVDPEPLRKDTEVQWGFQEPEQELVWERQDPVSLSPRRRRSELSLSESKLTDDDVASEQSYLLDEQKIAERYRETPERNKAVLGHWSPSQRGSKENLSSRGPDAGHFDGSVRAAPTRMSAKRRPLVKSNPVDV